jgi:hypothetical protein
MPESSKTLYVGLDVHKGSACVPADRRTEAMSPARPARGSATRQANLRRSKRKARRCCSMGWPCG